MFFKSGTITLSLLAITTRATAQRPENTTLCDYYAQTLLGANTASTQAQLMTLFLNTIVVGNYSSVNTGIAVAGAAAPAVYNGTSIDLLPYFDAGYASSNDYVTPHGVAINYLDDGGATPVAEGKPSNGNTTSNQYRFFTHTYAYFGTFLGCSLQGGSELPFYQGEPSMYKVHEYMDLDKYQMGFFIEMVGLAASSLGFLDPDVAFIKTTLNTVFNTRCPPATTLIPPAAGPLLQSICIADNCLLDPNATCSAYPNNGVALVPAVANATLVPNVTVSCHGDSGAAIVARQADSSSGSSATYCTVVSSSTASSSSTSGAIASTSASTSTSGAAAAAGTSGEIFGSQYLASSIAAAVVTGLWLLSSVVVAV